MADADDIPYDSRVRVSDAPGYRDYTGTLKLDAFAPVGHVGIVQSDDGEFSVHAWAYIHPVTPESE